MALNRFYPIYARSDELRMPEGNEFLPLEQAQVSFQFVEPHLIGICVTTHEFNRFPGHNQASSGRASIQRPIPPSGDSPGGSIHQSISLKFKNRVMSTMNSFPFIYVDTIIEYNGKQVILFSLIPG